jgi:hypothetical protein
MTYSVGGDAKVQGFNRCLHWVTLTNYTDGLSGFTFSEQVNNIIIKNVNQFCGYFYKVKLEYLTYSKLTEFCFLLRKEDYHAKYY